MGAGAFIERQITQIQQGGCVVLFRKMKIALQILLKLSLFILAVPFAIPVVLVLRIIRPWLLVRWHGLNNERIGHLVADVEMYLCEREAGINVPKQRHVDIFYMGGPVCNQQLAIMWKRVLRIWPSWILAPSCLVNRLIPRGAVHKIGTTQVVADVHNLLDRFPPHLEFTPEEEAHGEAGLRTMGIPPGTPFVCLSVRDSAYLAAHLPRDWSYHNYRDCDIQKYVLAAEELAERGYFVIRMGVVVKEAMKTTHPRIIDYVTNGTYDNFLDIYLGYKCAFCIGTGNGWDMVPSWGFRRPTLFTNVLPIGYVPSFSDKFIVTTKRHVLSGQHRELTVREIFEYGVGFCTATSDYESQGVELIENTPEEIRDVVIEMAERLNGTWQPHEDDEGLQRRFWEISTTNAMDAYRGGPWHGDIRARFGAHFLRNNRDWLK